MSKKLTTEEFIEKARKVHGNKYNYSQVEYINTKTKVCIICPTHGEFWQTPNKHLNGYGCKKCSGYFVDSINSFIEKAKEVHGDKYDYSKSIYVNARIKVCIVCPIHGEFWQEPYVHVGQKCGCPKCSYGQKRGLLFGIGINDLDTSINNDVLIKTYRLWQSMLNRCFDSNSEKNKTYKDCSVCDEWLRLSNFKNWFDEHYVEGWQLDKDLFSNGVKIYSPNTCCFLPHELNYMFRKYTHRHRDLPTGVYESNGRFNSILYTQDCTSKRSFSTVNEALAMYKKARKEKIHYLAEKYKDKLEERVYLKLLQM